MWAGLLSFLYNYPSQPAAGLLESDAYAETPYVAQIEDDPKYKHSDAVAEEKSAIWYLAQKHQKGEDKVLPTFVIETRSYLEKFTEAFYHADIISRAATQNDPLQRMITIVEWYLSGFYKKPKGFKKPYNPLLGETYRCYWEHANGSRTFYIAEQVSVEPPISAIYVTNRQDGFCLSSSIKTKYQIRGKVRYAVLQGEAILKLISRGETYTLTTPYVLYKGILVGTLSTQLGGDIYIESINTGYKTSLTFKLKPLMGSGKSKNVITGKIKRGKQIMATISGHWDKEMFIKDTETYEEKPLFIVNSETQGKRLVRYGVPMRSQYPHESEKLWQKVTAAIKRDDQSGFMKEERELLEQQRIYLNKLLIKNEVWVPRFFAYDINTNEWEYRFADERPWDARSDIRQFESKYKILTVAKAAKANYLKPKQDRVSIPQPKRSVVWDIIQEEGETLYIPISDANLLHGSSQHDNMEDQKNVIWDMVKKVGPEMDLSRVALPVTVLEPRSFLEKLTDSFFHADILSRVAIEGDPYKRMIIVVEWYLSCFYNTPNSLKKPYNPILGETFRCYWSHSNGSRTYFVAEQVSHHPPISAYHVSNRQDGFSVTQTILAKSKFHGNSTSAILEGEGILTILPLGERYLFTTPYAICRGLVMGTTSMELGGKTYIDCESTEYKTEIEFKLKPMMGGANTNNAISGKIQNRTNTLAFINGNWDKKMTLTDTKTNREQILFNVTDEAIESRLVRFVVPIDNQLPNESQRIWGDLTAALKREDYDLATEKKSIIENEQRRAAKERAAELIEWEQYYFVEDVENNRWLYKYADLRPWNPDTDIKQFEKDYKILTKSKESEELDKEEILNDRKSAVRIQENLPHRETLTANAMPSPSISRIASQLYGTANGHQSFNLDHNVPLNVQSQIRFDGLRILDIESNRSSGNIICKMSKNVDTESLTPEMPATRNDMERLKYQLRRMNHLLENHALQIEQISMKMQQIKSSPDAISRGTSASFTYLYSVLPPSAFEIHRELSIADCLAYGFIAISCALLVGLITQSK